LPFEVVVDTKHCLVFLPRILDVNAAGETQLMFRKAQLLQRLLRGNQAEALQRKSTNPAGAVSLRFLKFRPCSALSCTQVCVLTPAGKVSPSQSLERPGMFQGTTASSDSSLTARY